MDFLNTGNVFKTRSFRVGHARKVWRRINATLPGGHRIVNLEEWAEEGVIPPGTPLVKDASDTNAVKALHASGLTADGVVVAGLSDREVRDFEKGETATIAVVTDGEIYGYMLEDGVGDYLKTMTQTNGLQIRVIEG